MFRRFERIAILTFAVINIVTTTHVSVSQAATVFLDDFEDGDYQDGFPAKWIPAYGTPELEVVSGDLVVRTPGYDGITAQATNLNLKDQSVRTQLRLLMGGSAGVSLRYDPRKSAENGYYGLLLDSGHVEIGILGTGRVIAGGQTELRNDEEDIMFQMDAIGDTISLWAWKPSDPMPIDPVLQVVDETTRDAGDFLVGGVSDEYPGLGEMEFVYRYVHVADSHISDAELLVGDFDVDGSLTFTDVDKLTSVIRSGSIDARFDVSKDGKTDSIDRSQWVHNIKHTYFGDANLDGEFNSQDLISVFQTGQYEDGTAGNSTWATGDWNGDGEFDSGDFVLAFQDGGYEKGPRPAVNSVPEPAALPHIVVFAVAAALWQRSVLTRRKSVAVN
jgi:hypothetical protein